MTPADSSPPPDPAKSAVGSSGPKTGAGPARANRSPPSVEERLYSHGQAFEFFQAVRLLELLDNGRAPVGGEGLPDEEAVRLKSHLSLAFPASQIQEIQPPTESHPYPTLTATFMGLAGPNGALPRHYTEIFLRNERDSKDAEKRAARDWLDVFNHRLLSLFYRAWAKYRFYLRFERGDHAKRSPDSFTQALLSLVGLGQPPLRHRLQVTADEASWSGEEPIPLDAVDDQAAMYYGGLLARRPRTALGLRAMLADYFGLPVEVRQFQGEWLLLDPSDQSSLGARNCGLGADLVMGERTWDVEGKIRIVLGPLDYEQFCELLPDRSPSPRHKSFFLLSHLVRLYVGPTLDFEVQLVLRRESVPECHMVESNGLGTRLGWNMWLRNDPPARPSSDAVFAGQEVFWLNSGGRA